MTTRRRVLWTIVFTGLVSAACLWSIFFTSLEELVRDGIVLPIVYSLWLVSLLLRSFDQELVWVTLLVVLGVIFFYLLSRNWNIRLKPSTPSPKSDDNPGTVHWRIQFWHSKIHNLRNHGLESEFSVFEFRLLGRQVLAFTHGHPDSGGRIPEHVPQSAIEEAPASIQPLLQRPLVRNDSRPLKSLRKYTWRRQYAWRRFGRRTPATAAPETDPVLDLCAYLEQQLEIEDEQSEPDR